MIRLDFNNKIELISKYSISNYKVRYLKKPNPIILVALEDNLSINNGDTKVSKGESNPIIHERIVQRVVKLAVQSKVKSNNA